jgi:hypothetical protein
MSCREARILPDLSERQFRLLRRVDPNDVMDTLTPDQRPIFIHELWIVIINCIIHRKQLEGHNNEWYLLSITHSRKPQLFLTFLGIVANIVHSPIQPMNKAHHRICYFCKQNLPQSMIVYQRCFIVFENMTDVQWQRVKKVNICKVFALLSKEQKLTML